MIEQLKTSVALFLPETNSPKMQKVTTGSRIEYGVLFAVMLPRPFLVQLDSMLRFSVGSLLIATTFVAGLIAAFKHGMGTASVFVVMAFVSVLFAKATFDVKRGEKPNNAREKREREVGH